MSLTASGLISDGKVMESAIVSEIEEGHNFLEGSTLGEEEERVRYGGKDKAESLDRAEARMSDHLGSVYIHVSRDLQKTYAPFG